MYLDESGDHTVAGVKPAQWDKRYLCLFGISMDLEMCHRKFQPDFEEFKRKHFGGDIDDPVVLHREELKAKSGIFRVLADPAKCRDFNEEMLAIASSAPYRAFAVVIDKLNSQARHYGPVSDHPYHIGLLAMMERYCGWLKSGRYTGDILAESRGAREDLQLKAAYISIYSGGTRYYDAQFFQSWLSSKEIKIKPKKQNIAGLQLADLLAYPARKHILYEHGACSKPTGFTLEMAQTIEKRYNRRASDGLVKGYGKIIIA
jgi:hypothetical protein